MNLHGARHESSQLSGAAASRGAGTGRIADASRAWRAARGVRFYPRSFLELLLSAFLIFALPFVAVGAWVVWTMDRLVDDGSTMLNASLEAGDARRVLDRQLSQLERAAKQLQVLGDPLLRVQVEALHARLDATLEAYAGAAIDPAERSSIAELRTLAASVLRTVSRAPPDDPAFARAIADFDRLVALSQQLGQVSDAAQSRRLQELRERADRASRAVIVAALLMLVGGVVLAVVLARGIARPVGLLDTAVRGLGDGELAGPVRVDGPRDLVALGDRVEWLRQRLADVERQRIRYLQHVSHDLKTPLAALREGASLLADGSTGPMSEGQKEVVNILVDNARRLQRQIERLLAFASTPPARAVERKSVWIDVLVARVVEAQRLQWAARQLHVETRTSPVRAAVDEEMLRVIIDNLLSNAIRFSPPGGRIAIELDELPAVLRLRVADEGRGVPQQDRERVFEPFFTEQSEAADGTGTGLGLAIAREHARLHGGDLRLLPRHEGGLAGACFELEIPRHR